MSFWKFVRKDQKVFYSIIFTFLVLSFVFNIFGTGYGKQWFTGFQEDSAAIVEKTARCGGAVENYSGPLQAGTGVDYEHFIRTTSCVNKEYAPYVSQFGLQARVFAVYANGWVDPAVKIAKIALAIITAFILLVFIYRIDQLFGRKTAIITSLFVLISPWLVVYASNIYWVFPLMVLPFVLTFVVYSWFKKNDKLPILYSIIGLLFFIKFLNGYEHASTLIVSAFVPIVFYEMQNKKKRIVDLWKQAALILGVGIVALALAIFANIASLKNYAGSWSGAAEYVSGRVKERSASDKYNVYLMNGFEATSPEIYKMIDPIYDLDKLKTGDGNHIIYALVAVINYVTLPAITLPVVVKEPLATIVNSIAFITLLSILGLRSLRRSMAKQNVRGLSYAWGVALLGAVSWLVLMPGHTYPHAHLNAIVFYMPYLLLSFVIIGLSMDNYIKERHLNFKWKK